MSRPPLISPLFPYTTLFRSIQILMENGLLRLQGGAGTRDHVGPAHGPAHKVAVAVGVPDDVLVGAAGLAHELTPGPNLLRPQPPPCPELAGDYLVTRVLHGR